MKLSASRTAEAAAAAKAVPGSAMKASRMMGNSEAMKQATMTHQMKENLYGDLTGLIVRGVKHEGGNEVFDCIQTGRNGSKYSIRHDYNLAFFPSSGFPGLLQSYVLHFKPKLTFRTLKPSILSSPLALMRQRAITMRSRSSISHSSTRIATRH